MLPRTLLLLLALLPFARGGKRAINEAHLARILAALEAHRGKRILLVYGAAHRYWFRRELARRPEERLLGIREFLPGK